MDITCPACDAGTGSDGNPCTVCGGDGVITLIGSNFVKLINRWALHGVVWDSILTKLDDLEDKVDDVMDKCNDIFEKVNE